MATVNVYGVRHDPYDVYLCIGELHGEVGNEIFYASYVSMYRRWENEDGVLSCAESPGQSLCRPGTGLNVKRFEDWIRRLPNGDGDRVIINRARDLAAVKAKCKKRGYPIDLQRTRRIKLYAALACIAVGTILSLWLPRWGGTKRLMAWIGRQLPKVF